MYKNTRPQSRFSNRPSTRNKARNFGRGRGKNERIDISRFINKATVTEKTAPFVPNNTFQSFAIDEKIKNANTGTGKTAAYLIPLIHKILQNKKEQVMVIVPTRELAIQIDTELKELVQNMKIFSVCCVGGAPINKQIRDLRYQYNFIIGTPGRLKDLIDRKLIHLSEFNTIVLDEADRML